MKTAIGAKYEDLALHFLHKHKLICVERNMRSKGGEIDLIMREPNGTLVFVEVRARANKQFGGAIASVTQAKQNKIRRTALTYLSRHRATHSSCRFDVIAFEAEEINWIQNAFEDSYRH